MSPSVYGIDLANIPPAIIGMEACGASHSWARELTNLSHAPKSILCCAMAS
ncbi:transposase [Photobacterium sp. GJ3]|uniref:transposase n=1 Tax=Photobacterium sp. GJ3 TaxID=2829502 RepID=UPI001B8D6770|nr:transposase [Photobacterium sp. GJ3]QUJ66193.1 transposase [Photobacterium sp. GJ3]